MLVTIHTNRSYTVKVDHFDGFDVHTIEVVDNWGVTQTVKIFQSHEGRYDYDNNQQDQ